MVLDHRVQPTFGRAWCRIGTGPVSIPHSHGHTAKLVGLGGVAAVGLVEEVFRMDSGTQPALVPAVFETHDAAEVTIDALRRHGVDRADIGVLLPEPGRYYHREASDAEVFTAVG